MNAPRIYAIILPSDIDLEEMENGSADTIALAEQLIEKERKDGERRTFVMNLAEFQYAINHTEGFTDFLSDSYVQFATKLNDKED